MSSVVIELSREDARFVRQVLAFYEGYHLQNDVLQGKCKRIREYVLESEKADRSVIEWHEWDEKVPEEITEYHPILARWRDPIMKALEYDLSTKYDLYGCQEWAILPKGGEE